MSLMTLNVAVSFRRMTAAQWATYKEPEADELLIIPGGELVYETDTNRVKIGNGVDIYTALPYVAGIGPNVVWGDHAGDVDFEVLTSPTTNDLAVSAAAETLLLGTSGASRVLTGISSSIPTDDYRRIDVINADLTYQIMLTATNNSLSVGSAVGNRFNTGNGDYLIEPGSSVALIHVPASVPTTGNMWAVLPLYDATPEPGPTGVTGPTGATGAASTVAGPAGATGATGLVGVAGLTGVAGPTGPAGGGGAGYEPGSVVEFNFHPNDETLSIDVDEPSHYSAVRLTTSNPSFVGFGKMTTPAAIPYIIDVVNGTTSAVVLLNDSPDGSTGSGFKSYVSSGTNTSLSPGQIAKCLYTDGYWYVLAIVGAVVPAPDPPVPPPPNRFVTRVMNGNLDDLTPDPGTDKITTIMLQAPANRELRGLAAPEYFGEPYGACILLINHGDTGSVTLKLNATTSLEANRFTSAPGYVDYVLAPESKVHILSSAGGFGWTIIP